MQIDSMILNTLMFMIPLLLALSIHEFAHGLAANYLGDPTAKHMGRLTINPMAHADPIGTLLLPALMANSGAHFLIGWAKPVPVNRNNFKNPKRDMFIVASAGPISNLIQAFIGCLLYSIIVRLVAGPDANFFGQLLNGYILLNLGLAFFNLIPLQPLDGGHILGFFLSNEMNEKLEQNQMISNMILFAMVTMGWISKILVIPILFTEYYMKFSSEVFVHSVFSIIKP